MAETLLQHLYQEKLIEIRGQIGFQNHRYAMLERGWQRANRLLDLNDYIGRAPVSLQAYTDRVSQQRQDKDQTSPGDRGRRDDDQDHGPGLQPLGSLL